MHRAKFNANMIELLTILSDSVLESKSRHYSNADHTWKLKTLQNVGEFDFSDSVRDCDQSMPVGNVPNEHTIGVSHLQNIVEINIS